MSKEIYHSRVYTDRPPYADYEAPRKFLAIQSIVGKRLKEHPNAICSYSGGSDSDIMIDVIERARALFELPPIKYVFFNTGLEMKATKDHVKEVAQKYGVEIEEIRPKVNIVRATRMHGVPFVSKIMSAGLEGWQKKDVPLTIADEYANAEDKAAKRQELRERYPHCESVINFLCCCNSAGEPRPNIQLVINSSKFMLDFIKETPPINPERFELKWDGAKQVKIPPMKKPIPVCVEDYKEDALPTFKHGYICPVCKTRQTYGRPDYCPYCGNRIFKLEDVVNDL